MIKNYLYTAILFLFTISVSGQDKDSESLSFYPNPVSNGKIFIMSKTPQAKNINIFDVLGKKVFYLETTAKEINISSLSPGVYIIKLEDGTISSTRKLIVR